MSANLPSGRSLRRGEQLHRISSIEALENRIRQGEAIYLPSSLTRRMRGIVKILVFGFEEPVVRAVHRFVRQQVRSKEDAIRESQAEATCGEGLTTQLSHAG